MSTFSWLISILSLLICFPVSNTFVLLIFILRIILASSSAQSFRFTLSSLSLDAQIMRSSANAHCKFDWSKFVVPYIYFVYFTFYGFMSCTISINRVGLSTPPCRKPLFMGNVSECILSFLM